MIKYFLSISFLFLSFYISSQNINEIREIANFSNETELQQYIKKAKSTGLTLTEVENLAKIQGASSSEINFLKKLWTKTSNNDLNDENLENYEIKSSFGKDVTVNYPEKDVSAIEPTKLIDRFGSSFFNNQNISEVPQLFLSTPADYRLGPGDELIINIYGASANTYNKQISRDGTVDFERIAPVYLSGLSIHSAKNRLKNRLSKIYAGLGLKDELSKVEIEVSLEKARSIVVNITGQVNAPGTYTISAFSSVLNALFAAGGPNKIGSYRSIKILRNGKIHKIIDLYDYFVNGIYPNVYLRDQDVILVDAFQKEIKVKEGFKINGLFEMKENETINDLINYSGGLSSDSYKEKVFLNRIGSFSRSIIETSKDQFSEMKLEDGDVVSAKKVSSLIVNSVSIQGSVFIPGVYDLLKVSTVGQLIGASKGIMPDASSSSILYRYNNGFENEIISINLKNEDDLDIKLVDQDRLVVFSLENFKGENKISVVGEVNKPDNYDFKIGMTVRDVIQLSNGFSENANKSNVKLIRNISKNNTDYITEEFVIDFSDELNFSNIKLQPDDIVSISKLPYIQSTQSYSVVGQVSVQSSYPISTKRYSVKDAFRDNIVLTSNSSFSGIFVERDSIKIPISGSKVSQQIFEPDSDLELTNGDIINIPTINNTVLISGSVQQESIIAYEKSLSFRGAISSAGGVINNADLKRAYIEYQNGLKKSVKSFLGIKTYPKIKPGSKIFVPEKTPEGNKTSIGEIVGYTTSLVSIIALLKSL